MWRRPCSSTSWARVQQLPFPAQIYVASVVAAGTLLLGVCLRSAAAADPWLLAALVGLACLAATLRVTLPIPSNTSTLSVTYALDFASLLLVGADATMIVTAAGAI